MEENKNSGVKNWKPGDRIWAQLVAIKEFKVKAEGASGPPVTVTIYDHTGQRKAKWWTPAESQVELLRLAAQQEPPVILMTGMVDKKSGYVGELSIEGVTKASDDDADYAEAVFLALPDDHDELIAGLDSLIGSVRHTGLRALLAKTIGPEGRWRESYLIAVAAKSNHHAYPGGLLRHSIEVAEFALHSTRRFPVNRDLVLTAGLLHDLGKLWEMEHGWSAGKYTTAGTLKGHIVLAIERLGPLCRGLKLSEGLTDALLHAILAHHDELEFGSPVRPATAEAMALAKADQLSAELTQFFAARESETDAQTWRGGRSLYLGDLGLGALADTAPLPDDPEERLLRRMSEAEGISSGFGTVRLPILGVVAAGDGVRSSSDDPEPEEREVFPPACGADYLLKVTGDSMVGAGIHEGDLLQVKKQQTARPGQIVIAHVPEQGMVVKRLTETARGRELASENIAYAPIPVTEGVAIQGVVVKQEREL